ncbi:hypothetical protein [Aureimonas pseudogalii]|uniref:Uncharacterized protein n=1 Tax=Aureimonas pseudogalii TaxID=1744844 RepID=A0A7W6MMJ5_9HYPH|nr:hypothetical protein [Aureimonas pseudogalii]MBB4000902.1 hypothetical protein [Aureimonas pseudogalii]
MNEHKKRDLQALFGGPDLAAIDRSIAALMTHPTTSPWLHEAFKVALTLDPLDALKDAETLADMLNQRFNAVMREHGHIRFDFPD